jgi:hypothetical protein
MEVPLLVKAGEIVLVVIAVTILLIVARYLALRWRARTPRVQLSSVTQATPEAEEEEVDPLWVESLLREQLSDLRLTTADALPEASSGAPLMEIVEGIGEGIGDKSTLGNALGRLYRAVFPEAAYEVSATLRPSAASGGAVSVQVVDRTRRNPTYVNTARNDASWQEAARSAAAAVAGALYPQVAAHHRGPWTHWREPVPADLVILHDDARRHEDENQLDQAMGTYHRALDRDPLNPNLRLKIAMLEERLELDLSAWATYRAIADETHRDSWKGADRRVRLLALYRLAILVGRKRVASRWVSDPQDSTELEHREELRDALRTDRHLTRGSWWASFPRLAKRFPVAFTTTSSTRLLDDLGRPKAQEEDGFVSIADAKANRGQWLGEQLRKHDDEKEDVAEKRIRDLLEIVSLARLEQLDARLRRKPPWRPWRWPEWWRYRPAAHRVLSRREFSLSAVRVSKLIARIRIVASARERLAGDEPARGRAVGARDRLVRRWPFWPTLWRWPARLLRPRHRLADRRDDAWQFHYNAACAVSRAIRDEVQLGASKTRSRSEANLIEAGLKQLEEYVHRAGSDQVRAQADWVAREDDDLIALRETEEYVRWANHHLPDLPADDEQSESQIDPTRMAARIAYAGAKAFAVCWKARAEVARPEVELSAIWWREERVAWEVLDRIFATPECWRERWNGIEALQSCLRAGGRSEPIDAAYRPADSRASGDLGKLLLGLRGESEEAGWAPDADFRMIGLWAQQRAETAHAAREQAATNGHPRLRSRLEQREALRANRIWRWLGDALEAELDEVRNHTPGRRLRECLASIGHEISPQNGDRRRWRPRQIAGEAISVMRRNES